MTVYLVGAGPGDPGLLTVRGAELLRRADVVVYDRLASSALLALAPAGAELITAGKSPGDVDLTQDEINAVLVARGRNAGVVVRLKGGDPYVFGRGSEEAQALRAAGIPFEVVPGITSAIGAAAYAGIPVTHRGLSTHFTVVTGHEDPTKDRTDVDWAALARAGGTLVILMGAGRVGEIARRLIEGGRSPDTPVAAVRNGTRAEQHTVRATLATIADAGVRAPSAIVVGAVAGLDLSWFEARPLFGRTVVVTRAREQVSGLRLRLEELGAEVLELPAIEITPIAVTVPDLTDYEWLVFTSPNGVRAFFHDGLTPARLDARALAGVRLAAIGPGTAHALTTRGLRADLVPERFVAESLLEAFPAPGSPGERVLVVRPDAARDVLPEGLGAQGHEVDALAVYRTVQAEPADRTLEARQRGPLRRGDVHVVVDRRQLLHPDRPAPRAVPDGRVDRPGHLGDRGRAGPARRRRGRSPHHRRPRRRRGRAVARVTARGARPSSGSLVSVTFPARRMRRLRRTPAMRRLVAEARLSVDDLVAPLFVKDGIDAPQPIESMPGVVQHTQESLRKEVRALADLGVPAVILFGIPAEKDARGSAADAPDGVVQTALRNLRDEVGDTDLVLMADDCLDEYTDHGHCGILTADGDVDNDATLERYAAIAVSQADAGAAVIAPSGMMDGQVGVIRAALDSAGFSDLAILAYAAKYASALYGPFRDAAECAPQFGDRRGYQMDAANGREAVAEVALDIEEGADMVMVKPALAYLDVIAQIRGAFDVPVAAYHVSGEYAMVQAAAERGWIDGDAVMREHLLAIKRAGADFVLTYFARELAERLSDVDMT